MRETRELFESIGGEFVTPIGELAERLGEINAFIFDWDGVFNEGVKYGDQGSPFAEIDSMGTNLIRLAYWLQNDGKMPVCGVITGAVNAGTEYIVRREHFDFIIRGFTNKRKSWQHFLEMFDLPPQQVMYVFDDVLDLPIAAECGLRFLVGNRASPAFRSYCIDHDLCDYITGCQGGEGAVREISELILEIWGMYHRVLDIRTEYSDEEYGKYLDARQAINPRFISPESDPQL